MNKIALILTVFLVICTSSWSQDAKNVFANVPDSIIPLLTPINRADFIDFLASDMRAIVKNKLDGNSEMTDLTPDYIRIQMSGMSTWEMKLLNTTDSTKIVCVISTACAPACDSQIRFFTTGWEELPILNYIKFPSMVDFLKQPDQDQEYAYQELIRKADMFLRKAELSKDSQQLKFTFTTPDYMGKESGDEIRKFVVSPLLYDWKGHFILAGN